MAEIDKITAQFEQSNPGFTLYANSEVRSLDDQIGKWNSNPRHQRRWRARIITTRARAAAATYAAADCAERALAPRISTLRRGICSRPSAWLRVMRQTLNGGPFLDLRITEGVFASVPLDF